MSLCWPRSWQVSIATSSTVGRWASPALCVRTIGRLKEQGFRTCFLDLTKFGGRNLTAEQWYAALLAETGRELGLRAEFVAYWKQNTDVGPMQRFFGALRDLALPASPQPLVVFVDEIDVTLQPPLLHR